MATYTPNLNLGKPEATDAFGNFRQLFNDNMDILDNGGGGGSGGHTIYDENGSAMPQETGLQFTGNVSVTDDNVNGKTIVDILGGGGNVYGAFIDTNRVLASGNYSYSSPLNYTATEDCFACVSFVSSEGDKNVYGYIDGELIFRLYDNSNVTVDNQIIPLKKGQVLRVETSRTANDSPYTIYGTTQGTNGIFTPIIYSDTERVVGVWRDNKPLYQKTFNITPTSNNFNIDVASLNIETMVSRFGSFTRLTNGITQQKPIEYRTESATYNSYGISCAVINSDLSISIESYPYTEILNLRVTLQYTKTTDVAGSGNWNTDGVPTVHYSTSEQVIGTWENGKPLYRRTFTTSTMNISASAGALYSGSVTIGDYIPDVDQIFVDIGKTYITVSGVTRGLVSASQQGSNISVYSEVSRSNCTITITADYTKTTD